jgi:hypothetical protein
MALECASVIDICALRATRLHADGSPAEEPNNVYIVNDLLQVQVTENNEQGQSRVMNGGCGGCEIARRDEPDKFIRYDLEIQAGRWEPGLIEMLTGRAAIVDTGGNILGVHGPRKLACGEAPALAAIETWSTRYLSTDEQDPVYPWFRMLFVASTWVLGQQTLQSDFSPFVLTGKTKVNSSWGIGPYGDQIEAIGAGEHSMTWLDSGTLPAATCDYSDVLVVT